MWLVILLEHSINVGPRKAGHLESRFQDVFGAWLSADIVAVREDRALALSCFVTQQNKASPLGNVVRCWEAITFLVLVFDLGSGL